MTIAHFSITGANKMKRKTKIVKLKIVYAFWCYCPKCNSIVDESSPDIKKTTCKNCNHTFNVEFDKSDCGI